MSFIYKFWTRSKLGHFIFTAGCIGVIGSSTLIFMHHRTQRLILQKPYCVEAFRIFEGNEAVVKLVGQPIVYHKPDIADRATKLNADIADLKVPFIGKNKAGLLHIIADRFSFEDDWSIKRLEATFQTMPDKLLIVYKRKEEDEQPKPKPKPKLETATGQPKPESQSW